MTSRHDSSAALQARIYEARIYEARIAVREMLGADYATSIGRTRALVRRECEERGESVMTLVERVASSIGADSREAVGVMVLLAAAADEMEAVA